MDAFNLSESAVRARFGWAVRSGHPSWLWPDVSTAAWQAALRQIEEITRQVLRTGRSDLTLTGDPGTVSVAAFTSGMGPLIGHWINEGRATASPSAGAVLRSHLRHNEARMSRLAARAVAVVESLARSGLEVCLLKGIDTSMRYFPAPSVRPMSDIDLLIDPADEPAASVVLRRMGFEPSGKATYPERTWREPLQPDDPKNLYFLHKDERWSIDLHTTLNLRHTSVMSEIRLDETDVQRESWPRSPRARVLGQPSLLLHLALHAGVNLVSLSLLRLVELVLVTRHDLGSGALRWERFLASAERIGGLGSAYPALRLCEQLVPGTIPADVLDECRSRAPRRAARFVDRLTPATAQRILRCSMAERFMWFPTPALALRQVISDILPLGKISPTDLLHMYEMRAWRLVRGQVTR